jgi:BlaI family transcriptional regulator, penicillinase repressor
MKRTITISAKEWEVMEWVWIKDTSTASEIIRALNATKRKWHPKTVKTHLGRLLAKGVLVHHKESRRYRYQAAMSRSDCLDAACTKFLNNFFKGSVVCLMKYFDYRLARPWVSHGITQSLK